MSSKSVHGAPGEVNAADKNKHQKAVESWLRSELGVKGSCKDFVEAHLAEKCQNRSAAEKKFRWDMSMFSIYLLFLILYSLSACGTNMKGNLQVRSMIKDEIGFFEDIQKIGEPLRQHVPWMR